MNKFFTWLAKAMDEAPGEPSALRVLVVFGSFVSILVPSVLWTLALWSPAALAAAPGASTFFGTVLGALLTAKVWQKGVES